MFETVAKVRTLDGKIFDTEEEAESYIVDELASEVDEWFKGKTSDFRHRDRCAVLTELVGNTKNIKRLHSLLSKFVPCRIEICE